MKKKPKRRLNDLVKTLGSIRAEDIMTKDVITTTEQTTLADLAVLMVKKRISGLPVVGKRGKITGIITATDLFIVMDMIKSGDVSPENNGMSVSNPTVKFVMSTEIVKAKKETTLEEVFTIMKYRDVSTLPVFDGKKLVGIIARHDAFKKFYAVLKSLDL